MKKWFLVTAALALAALIVPVVLASRLVVAGPNFQDGAGAAQTDPKKAEADAYKAWYDARADLTKALPLAKDYVAKFPNGQYAVYLKGWIGSARAALFNKAMSSKDIPSLIRLGNEHLAESPNDVNYLYLLAVSLRQDELANQNFSHEKEAEDYTNRVIKLIEGGAVPATVEKSKFDKNAMLGYFYQSLGMTAVNHKDTDKALEYYDKAGTLDPKEPFSFLECGTLHQLKYQGAMTKYQAIPQEDRDATDPKPEVKAALDDVNKQADAVIDCWARFMALSESNTGYSVARSQVSPALTVLYKYRHPDAPDGGLQKLIDQYKNGTPAPAPGGSATASGAQY